MGLCCIITPDSFGEKSGGKLPYLTPSQNFISKNFVGGAKSPPPQVQIGLNRQHLTVEKGWIYEMKLWPYVANYTPFAPHVQPCVQSHAR